MYLIPPAASWSRLRSSTTPGQLSLRSRSEPLGLLSLNPQQTERVRQSNREMEAVSWLAAQSARCKVRRVGVVLIFPEDFGGYVTDGAASPWLSREFQDLEGACDVRRDWALLCHLASTDQRRPVGILTNLPTLQSRLSLHWPILERCGDEFSTKVHSQNHALAIQPVLRLGERMLRSTSSPPLPNRRAQCSGQSAWPTWTTSIPLGMDVHSNMLISVPRFHSLRLPIPELLFMATGWARRFLVPCLLILGALDRLTLYFWSLRSRSRVGGLVFHLLLASLLWGLRCRRLLPRRSLHCLLCQCPHAHFRVFLIGATARSQIANSCSFGRSDDFHSWQFENSPGPHEAKGFCPSWLCGTDGGSCLTGASDGLVRTRSCL